MDIRIVEKKSFTSYSSLLFFSLVIIFIWATGVWAVNYVDDFASSTFGTGPVTSFTTGSAATGLLYTAEVAGDECDFSWSSGNPYIDILSVDGNDETTELVTIVSRDGKAFVFNSMWYNVSSSSLASNVTISGTGPEPFTITTGGPSSSGTYSPVGGAKLVKSIQVSSVDFCDDGLDDVDVELDVPGLEILGNGVTIVNGDGSPSVSDDTDFGTLTGPASKTFTINSIGDLPLDLSGAPYVTFSSNPSGDFSISAQPTTDPIASGGSDTFTILCTPTTPGVRTAVVSITNNSEASPYTFTITSNGDASLPVELMSFAAVSKNGAVVLEWTTASESDNLGFIIERRSKNGDWQQIASYKASSELAGQGTTQAPTQYSFNDASVITGSKYSYRLSDVDVNGDVTVIATTEVETMVTPTTTQLFAAYPNPFNPSTNLKYQLAQEGHVELAVYDVLGRKIKMLADQQQAAGEYSLQWNGTTDAGLAAPSGTYLVRMQAGAMTQVQKVLFVK